MFQSTKINFRLVPNAVKISQNNCYINHTFLDMCKTDLTDHVADIHSQVEDILVHSSSSEGVLLTMQLSNFGTPVFRMNAFYVATSTLSETTLSPQTSTVSTVSTLSATVVSPQSSTISATLVSPQSSPTTTVSSVPSDLTW